MKNKLFILFLFLIGIIVPKNIYAIEDDVYEINLYEYKNFEEIEDEKKYILMAGFKERNYAEEKCEYEGNTTICKLWYNKKPFYTYVDNGNDFEEYFTLDDFTVEDTIEYELSEEDKERFSNILAGINKIRVNFSKKQPKKEVYIREISFIDKSETTIIKTETEHEILNINVDLKFQKINDYITYNVLVKNNTDKDYEISDETKYGENEYIKYEFFPKDGNILKANTEKEVEIKISYDKEIPVEILKDGFTEDKAIEMVLFDENSKITNPKTGNHQIVIFIIILLLVITLILSKKEARNITSILLLFLLLIPFTARAYEQINITINSSVEVPLTKYKFVTNQGSFSETEDVKETYMTVIDDGYKYTEYSLLSISPKINPCIGLRVSINKTHFSNDSYIKIYDLNHNLLLEINQEKFPKNRFDIKERTNLYDNIYLDYAIPGICDKNQITVETNNITEDDETYNISQYTTVIEKVYNGPWIMEEKDINKINILRQSLIQNQRYIAGFIKCSSSNNNDDDENINNECENNVYYTTIKDMESQI